MSTIDVILFVVAVVGVIGLGIWKSQDGDKGKSKDESASGYFLAGRGLSWWLVGFSLIAANISTEQFVGMSGKASDWLGMAIASYEWMAAITLVVVAFLFLPKLLRCGIYTIPEFLEYRYGWFSRTVMAIATMVILVGVPTASVIFSGAKVVSVFFQDTSMLGLDLGNITVGCWLIGTCAAVYVFIGGLKACAWTDLIWGAALIVGGAIVMFLAFNTLGERPAAELMETKVANSDATLDDIESAGAWERFMLLNDGKDGEAIAVDGANGAGGKIHMVRPKTDPEIPWTVLILGLWIPNFFYWGLNQYIMQRTLGSKSLAEGQKGVIFAAALKLIIPFIVVIPGILAFNLFNSDLQEQADIKNSTVLEVYEAGEFDKAILFTDSFVRTSADKIPGILSHNAKLAGAETSIIAAGLPTLADGELNRVEIIAINNDLISKASEKGVKTSMKLTGYDYDAAFPTLLKNLLKPGFTWFVLAAIFGAVVSSLASMLNSASTIATMDIVGKLGKVITGKELEAKTLIKTGRGFVVIFVIIACLIAPSLGRPEFGGIFTFIQEFQGFISSGILAAFLFGFLVPKAPRYLGWLSIILNVVLYGSLKLFLGSWIVKMGWWFAPEISFLDRMGICFLLILAICGVLTAVNPLKKAVVMPVTDEIALESSKTAKIAGIGVVVGTVLLYFIFW